MSNTKKTVKTVSEAQGAVAIDELTGREIHKSSFEVVETRKPSREYKLSLKSIEVTCSRESNKNYGFIKYKNGDHSTTLLDYNLYMSPAGTKVRISTIYTEFRKDSETGEVSPFLCGEPLL